MTKVAKANTRVSPQVLQFLSGPYCRVPQDMRTLPDRSQIPLSAPRFTVLAVGIGWFLCFMMAAKVGKTAYEDKQWALRQDAAIRVATDTAQRVQAATDQSAESKRAEQFVNEQEALLAGTVDVVGLLRRLIESKPASLRMTSLDFRRPVEGGGANLNQWDVMVQLRNDESQPAEIFRAGVIKGAEGAGIKARLIPRPPSNDPRVVEVNMSVQFEPAATAKKSS